MTRSFSPTLPAALLAATLAGLAGPARAAADVLVDDFTTGFYRSPQVKSGIVDGPLQTGRMLGGSRLTRLDVCDTDVPNACTLGNPYNLGNAYAIARSRNAAYPPALSLSSGALVGPRLDVYYGEGPAGMNVDLGSSPTRRLRLSFGALSQPLNFNVLMYSGAARSQDGCNVLEINHPFVIEVPFAEFTAEFQGGFDPHAVTLIDLALGSGSAIGSIEWVLEKVEVSDTTLPGAIHCGPIGQ